LLRRGFVPNAGSSWSGERFSGAPLGQRPIIFAPRSAYCSGLVVFARKYWRQAAALVWSLRTARKVPLGPRTSGCGIGGRLPV
jgi:hypothetical protein